MTISNNDGHSGRQRLDDDEKNTVISTDGNRGNPNMTIVSEPGLYALVLGSRKPEAKAFKRWITHTCEVCHQGILQRRKKRRISEESSEENTVKQGYNGTLYPYLLFHSTLLYYKQGKALQWHCKGSMKRPIPTGYRWGYGGLLLTGGLKSCGGSTRWRTPYTITSPRLSRQGWRGYE